MSGFLEDEKLRYIGYETERLRCTALERRLHKRLVMRLIPWQIKPFDYIHADPSATE